MKCIHSDRITQLGELEAQVNPTRGTCSGTNLFATEYYNKWLQAVEEYSARALSCQTNRLPALSGLAAGPSVLLDQDEYWAGIWRGDLARSLVWTPDITPYRRSYCWPERQPHLAKIPSWSWASYDGPILFATF